MMKTLTEAEMLEIWRLKRYHERLNDSLSIEVDEGYGPDTEKLDRLEMREWYLNALDHSPVDLLPIEDVSDRVELMIADDGTGIVTLPRDCRRLTAVMLSGWRSAPQITDDPESGLALLQESPMTRGGSWSPVVVKDGRTLYLYTPEEGSTAQSLERLECVVEPPEGEYRLDERLFCEI